MGKYTVVLDEVEWMMVGVGLLFGIKWLMSKNLKNPNIQKLKELCNRFQFSEFDLEQSLKDD